MATGGFCNNLLEKLFTEKWAGMNGGKKGSFSQSILLLGRKDVFRGNNKNYVIEMKKTEKNYSWKRDTRREPTGGEV